MGRAGHLAVHHAAHLGELVHQPDLVVEAAGRVDEDHVRAARLGRGERVEGDRGGVGALVLLDDLDAGARGPDVELLGRGRAERVGRAQEHALAGAAVGVGHLADRGRLADAVDADDHHDVRALRQRRVEVGRAARVALEQQVRDLVADEPVEVGRGDVLVARDARLDAADDLDGRGDARRRRRPRRAPGRRGPPRPRCPCRRRPSRCGRRSRRGSSRGRGRGPAARRAWGPSS